jgi:hypothetical protein
MPTSWLRMIIVVLLGLIALKAIGLWLGYSLSDPNDCCARIPKLESYTPPVNIFGVPDGCRQAWEGQCLIWWDERRNRYER